MVVQPSPGASAIPLSIEPVIGWRVWCIQWDGNRDPVLTSPLRPYRWRPMVPNHAGCHRHVGKQVPTLGCSCGLYAVSDLERLARAFGVGSTSPVGVVGSVAMWGRVIEHAQGYRGQLAYPDRVRLICRDCFFSGRTGVPTRVELDPLGNPLPVCDGHAVDRRRDRDSISPDELQGVIRSTYAVDLLPVETLHEAGFVSGSPSPATFRAAAKAEARELTKPRSGVLAIVLLFLVGLAMNVVGPFPTPGAPGNGPEPIPSPVVAPAEGPFPDDVVVKPPVELARPRPEPRSPSMGFGIVCGHRVGTAVLVMACGRARAELIGVYSSPPDARSGCVISTGYTRKPNVSVCWLDPAEEVGPPFDVLRLPGVHLRDFVA